MRRNRTQKSEFYHWGRDKSGVWHITPCMVITSLGLIDHSCTEYDTYIKVPDWLEDPPDGAQLCPVCRSVLTRMIVEGA